MGFDLKEGTLFAGRYQIVRALGMGAMGAVYEVLHVETERRRALKVMLPMLSNDPALWDRFRQETKVAAHVDSEFIVDVFDAGVEEQTGLPFFVMELLRGEDLERRIERLGPLPPAEVVTYLHQVALALDKTHRASIVHRDLKPENLFLTVREDGQPRIKVLDFGIAKLLAGPNGARATQNLGTPLYMAPEQLSAESGVLSGATDIYGLGMVAYTLLVGKSYWETEAEEGHSLFALLATVSRGPTAPACARAAASGVHLPPAFDAWFARATAPVPEDRFQSATEAVRELVCALGLPSLRSSIAPPPFSTGTGGASGNVSRSSALGHAGTSTSALATPASTAPMNTSQPRRGGVVALAIALGIGALLGAGVYALQLARAPATDEAAEREAESGAARVAPGPEAPPKGAAAAGDPAPEISAVAPAPTQAASAAPAASASAAPPASASAAPPSSTQPPAGTAGTPGWRRRYTRD